MYYEINEDLPIENFIKNKNLDVGFIDINGEILNLKTLNSASDGLKGCHAFLSKIIVYKKFFYEYAKLTESDFCNKPFHMLQEEYFLLKYKKFVKVKRFYEGVTDLKITGNYDRVITYYNELSPKQIELIYPR